MLESEYDADLYPWRLMHCPKHGDYIVKDGCMPDCSRCAHTHHIVVHPRAARPMGNGESAKPNNLVILSTHSSEKAREHYLRMVSLMERERYRDHYGWRTPSP